MVRNFKQDEQQKEKSEEEETSKKGEREVIVEREVTLSLLNEKLNYIISKINDN